MIGVTNPREDREIARQDPESLEIWAGDCQMRFALGKWKSTCQEGMMKAPLGGGPQTRRAEMDGWQGQAGWEGMRSGGAGETEKRALRTQEMGTLVCSWQDWLRQEDAPMLCAAWGPGRLTCERSCVSYKAGLWLHSQELCLFALVTEASSAILTWMMTEMRQAKTHFSTLPRMIGNRIFKSKEKCPPSSTVSHSINTAWRYNSLILRTKILRLYAYNSMRFFFPLSKSLSLTKSSFPPSNGYNWSYICHSCLVKIKWDRRGKASGTQ